jgi:hypothetical protein
MVEMDTSHSSRKSKVQTEFVDEYVDFRGANYGDNAPNSSPSLT